MNIVVVTSMTLRSVLASLVLMMAVMPAVSPAGQSRAPLVLERQIPLADVRGRIDHMAVDVKRKRLFVAERGNNSVDVVDLANGTVIHRIAGLKAPQGIGYLQRSDQIAIANGGDGTVAFYDSADFATTGLIILGDDADDVRVESSSGALVVGYGDGGLAIIDPEARALRSKTELRGHPEGFQIAADGHKAFVNVPDAHEIAIVNLNTGRQVGNWSIPHLSANFPMAFIKPDGILVTAFRSPPTLVLLDSLTGKIRSRRHTCGDADDIYLDSTRRRIYVSCGAGTVDVLGYRNGTLRQLGEVPSAAGARTSLFVPKFDRLYVAAPAVRRGGQAKMLVFRPSGTR